MINLKLKIDFFFFTKYEITGFNESQIAEEV